MLAKLFCVDTFCVVDCEIVLQQALAHLLNIEFRKACLRLTGAKR